MIKNLINSFVKSLLDELNLRLGAEIQINKIQSTLDMEDLPLNETAINYQIFVPSIEDIPEWSTQVFDTMRIRIDFVFLIVNNDTSVYELIFDRYIYPLRRIARSVINYSDPDISYALGINEINRVRILNGDLFDGEYYKPSIEIDMTIYDYTEVGEIISNNNNVIA